MTENEIFDAMLDNAWDEHDELLAYRAIGTVEEVQKAVKEEDVLKFYYCESEDSYLLGIRVDNFYYAHWDGKRFVFDMSRYLPWGKHVVAPETAWKEHTYPTEPKEIDFSTWLQGFIKKECGGTIEELQALKEKAEPKKPIIMHEQVCDGVAEIEWECPVCGRKCVDIAPLAIDHYAHTCRAFMHYDRHKREWVVDERR